MKEYTFEYTRQGFAYLLFGLSFAIVILGLLVFAKLPGNSLSPGIGVIIIIGLGVAFFLINKHRIKRIGIAKLSINDLTIELSDVSDIAFADLKYYYIYDGKNGVVFTLGFNDGTKFKIGANNNFCNTDLFKAFLIDFQATVENFKTQNKVDIIHLETIFAKKQTVYILSIFTVLVIGGFCFTRMPVMILPIAMIPSLLIGWIKYFQQRSKNKLVDF